MVSVGLMNKDVNQKQEHCFGFRYDRGGDTYRLILWKYLKKKKSRGGILKGAQRTLHRGGGGR